MESYICRVLSAVLAFGFVAGCGGEETAKSEVRSASRQVAAVLFTERAAASATGLHVEIDYVRPERPADKPHAVRRIVLELAPGSTIDPSAMERCAASDAELMLLGDSACSTASRLGTGAVTIDTGLAGPLRYLETDLTLLNDGEDLVFLFTDRRTGLRLASRAQIEGATVTSTAPFLPGSPPDGAAVDTVIEELDRVEDGGQAYLRTPPRCPPSGYWLNRVSFTYADGVSESVASRSACDA